MSPHKSMMTIPTSTLWTPPWYATIPDLLCVIAVPVMLKICGLCLGHFSALVCDLLSRMGVYPVIRWKVGPHRSGALCWWTWYRLLGNMDLKYSFEANNTPCVFSCITALSSVRLLVFPQENIGERWLSHVWHYGVNLHWVWYPLLIIFPVSRTLLIGFSPEWGGTTRLGYTDVLVVQVGRLIVGIG